MKPWTQYAELVFAKLSENTGKIQRIEQDVQALKVDMARIPDANPRFEEIEQALSSLRVSMSAVEKEVAHLAMRYSFLGILAGSIPLIIGAGLYYWLK